MLDTAPNVNFILVGCLITMSRMIVQIYEVQMPSEAEAMIGLGVDHIGSVVLKEAAWKVASIKETINLVHTTHAKSSLIPLFSGSDNFILGL